MKKVSIIMPLHNKGAYVTETLESLQRQLHEDWEAVVVENHSEDDGPQIVSRMAKEDQRIQLHRAPLEIRGPGAARNYGLDLATGSVVLFLDADDLLEMNHLSSQIFAMENSSARIAVSNWLEFVDGEPGDPACPEDQQAMRKMRATGSGNPSGRLEDSTIAFAPWAVHCALVDRRCFTACRRWLPELDRFASEDTAFWFRLLHGELVVYTNEYTALYRTETSNYRNQHQNLRFWFDSVDAYVQMNLEWLTSIGISPNSRQVESLMRLWENLSKRAYRQGEKRLSETALEKAEFWLDFCNWSSSPLSVKLRKISGLKRHQQLTLFKERLWRSFNR